MCMWPVSDNSTFRYWRCELRPLRNRSTRADIRIFPCAQSFRRHENPKTYAPVARSIGKKARVVSSSPKTFTSNVKRSADEDWSSTVDCCYYLYHDYTYSVAFLAKSSEQGRSTIAQPMPWPNSYVLLERTWQVFLHSRIVDQSNKRKILLFQDSFNFCYRGFDRFRLSYIQFESKYARVSGSEAVGIYSFSHTSKDSVTQFEQFTSCFLQSARVIICVMLWELLHHWKGFMARSPATTFTNFVQEV